MIIARLHQLVEGIFPIAVWGVVAFPVGDINRAGMLEHQVDGSCDIPLAFFGNLRNVQPKPPEYRFYVTDVPLRFQAIGERFLGRAIENITVLKW